MSFADPLPKEIPADDLCAMADQTECFFVPVFSVVSSWSACYRVEGIAAYDEDRHAETQHRRTLGVFSCISPLVARSPYPSKANPIACH